MMRYPLRLGIVGCGAVVEMLHLPASLMVPEVDIVALVDRNADRAQSLASRYGIPFWFDDHRALIGQVDAALVATPPALHAPVACDLLRQNVHVLCEKPLAPTVADCESMRDAAKIGHTVLSVAHNRRFAWNVELLRSLLIGGGLGEVTSIKAEDGFVFGWPARTDYTFQRAQVGGGVLIEHGVHVIDTLLWLFGDADVEEYQDDALGGLEANARLRLRASNGATARLWVTRTCEPRNCLYVVASDGWAEMPLYDTNRLEFKAYSSKAGQVLGPVTIVAEKSQDYMTLIARQLADFARCALEQRVPRASAEDGTRAIRLIQSAYAMKQARPMPEKVPLPGETW